MTELNKNEMEAMRILWRGGEHKPAEIQAEFSWSIENATLRSALAELVNQGLAAREKQGKAFFYRAAGSQRSAFSKMAQRMAHVFTGGSTAGLIAQLIQNEKLSVQEIGELRRLAAQKTSGSGKMNRR
ncbi:MAG: BlaI/MecI/CopY family transcriptional regulator [Candidatus Sumerlaeota bacterium]|nr:BlaI/MecI/CopY family transcriptional regulator [Candidatus Sumerlaeota bacterium]